MSTIKEQYMNLVCSKNTDFLNEHLVLPELMRLDSIGQLCGCDCTALYNKYISDWLSILDHSVIAAKMVYHFTGDERLAVLELYHDVFKPAFAHAADYTFNDPTKQETAEKLGREYVKFSNKTIELLKKYGISIYDLYDLKQYTVLENEKPKLCTDRLDGVLHTNLIWRPNMSTDEATTIYNDLTILTNEDGEQEIGFKTLEIAEQFGKAIYHYSMSLKSNTDIFTLCFIGDILKTLINNNLITKQNLWEFSDQRIIDIISKSKLKDYWKVFQNTTEVINRTKKPDELTYYVRSIGKKRTVDPLCLYNDKPFKLEDISDEFHRLMTDYRQTEEKPYCCVKGLDRFLK